MSILGDMTGKLQAMDEDTSKEDLVQAAAIMVESAGFLMEVCPNPLRTLFYNC